MLIACSAMLEEIKIELEETELILSVGFVPQH